MKPRKPGSLTRRQFIRLGAAGGSGLYLSTKIGGVRYLVHAALPGGTLDAASIPKFITPLLVPPAMPRAAKLPRPGRPPADYYEIAVRQFRQQILPASLPPTTVWGYGPAVAQNGPQVFNAPALTIEAKHNRPVRVKWINQLVDDAGDYLRHLLPVDPTLHWANPGGGVAGRDTRPLFADTPSRYTGPIPIVTHVHGALSVGDESDGYPEAWFLPAANNIPEGYATEGTWYDFFRDKAAARFGAEWGPGFAVFEYPNVNRAAMLWYHDHTLGLTRLNVYAGPAGFYIIRGGPGDEVVDSRTGKPAQLPGPAPAAGDRPGTEYYEIPLAIQDRAFNADGSLFYPDTREFFDGFAGPYVPHTDVAPLWNPEFFGNCLIVNGHTWPFHAVEQRRYRLRILNGCQSRFLILDFNAIAGVDVWQIGNETGFLATPVPVTASAANRLLLAPAERADLIVDFTNVPEGRYVLANVGPDEPFGGGDADVDFDRAAENSTGQVMEFRVGRRRGADRTTPPQFLVLPAIAAVPAPIRTRPLALLEMMSMYHDGPAAAMLGTVSEGTPEHHMWSDPVTENPQPGDTEVWELYNLTADAHPIHVHDVLFEVVDRQALEVNDDGEAEAPVLQEGSVARPPEPGEAGLKETVIAYPGEVTRIKATFETPGQYVWHCHILEHEDNEMMRPFRVGPVQPGQPPGKP